MGAERSEAGKSAQRAGFVHLHVHSEYSLLDSAAPPDGLVQKAKNLAFPAIALTDHGNLFGAVDFYSAAKKAGVKPIVGCELYVAPGSRFAGAGQGPRWAASSPGRRAAASAARARTAATRAPATPPCWCGMRPGTATSSSS